MIFLLKWFILNEPIVTYNLEKEKNPALADVITCVYIVYLRYMNIYMYVSIDTKKSLSDWYSLVCSKERMFPGDLQTDKTV